LRWTLAKQLDRLASAHERPKFFGAWVEAQLVDAELHLVGYWQLAESKRRSLVDGVRYFSR
jgi:hypothetical protein